MKRDPLVHTFGVMLAGLLAAEKCAGDGKPRREPRVRHGSGVYRRPDTEPPPATYLSLSEPPVAF
jgi:hypothetical protein